MESLEILELWKIKTIFPKDIQPIVWRYVIDSDCGHVVTEQIAKYKILQKKINNTLDLCYQDPHNTAIGMCYDIINDSQGIQRLIYVHNDKHYAAMYFTEFSRKNTKLTCLRYNQQHWKYIEYYIDFPKFE